MSSNNKYFNKLLKFNNSKKAVSGVVALTVFLVITVISVLGFQTWYTSYGGQIESNLHEEAEKIPTISVLSSNEDIFYLRNNKKTKIDIIKFVINGYDCGNGGSYNPGIFEMDMNCDYALDREKSELLIITTTGVYSHKFFVDEVFSCKSNNAEGFAGGNGFNTPWEICNCEMLQNIMNDNGGGGVSWYELTTDVDCSETTTWNGGKGFRPLINLTSGVTFAQLSGNGNSIRNLYINRPLEDLVALSRTNDLDVNNIALLDVDIVGNDEVSGLMSYMNTGASNLYVTGEISGNDDVGGIEGYGPVAHSNLYSNVKISGNSNLGLIKGSSTSQGISDVFALGEISGASNYGALIGNSFGNIACGNSFWNNNSLNPNEAVGSGDSCLSGSITTIQNDESYFYGNTNEPMASWDEDVWSFAPDRLPKLKEQN